MNIKQSKAKYILYPLFVCTTGIGILCSLFNYLLLYQFQIIEIDELYSDFLIPAGIITLCVLFLLRPVINLMDYGDKGKDFITIITIILSVIPVVTFQMYIKSETGALTKVKTPEEIHQLPFTKYYKIDDYFIDITHSLKLIDSHTHKSTLSLTSCFAIPLKKNIATTETNTWYCSCYKDETHNGIFTDKAEINEWAEKILPGHVSRMKYDAAYKKAVYFKRVTKSELYDNYVEAISNKWDTKNAVFLEPQYENFKERASGLLGGTLVTFILFNLLLPLLYWFSPYVVDDFGSKRATKLSKRINTQKIKNFLAFCLPQKGIYFTLITIYLNVIVFIIMHFQGVEFFIPGAADMVEWGGNMKSLTLGGEYYRLLFSVFIHAGFLHLLMNMVSLYFIGIFLEPSSGTFKTSLVYLFSGIAGGLSSLFFHESNYVSVGASGAIFGLFGFFLALIITNSIDRGFKALLKPILIFLAYNIFMGLFGNIDLAGHIGGLLFGFASGLLMSLPNRITKSY